MARIDLALLVQDLQRKGRRGERQRKADEQRLAESEAEAEADGSKHQGRRHELGRAQPEDRRAHCPESHRAKLEPDHEQQHDDAELAEMQDALDAVELVERPENIRADDDAGGEITEHSAHAKEAAERRCNGSCGEKYRHLDQLRRDHRPSLCFPLRIPCNDRSSPGLDPRSLDCPRCQQRPIALACSPLGPSLRPPHQAFAQAPLREALRPNCGVCCHGN